MEAVSGGFKDRSEAERTVHEFRKAAVPADKVTLLTLATADPVAEEYRQFPPTMPSRVPARRSAQAGAKRRSYSDLGAIVRKNPVK